MNPKQYYPHAHIEKPEKSLDQKTIEWLTNAYAEIHKAGGCPAHVVGEMNPKTLETFIRNGIHLEHRR